MKKFAFTLSEVLITLSIVGLVSVLVLPNLMGDAFKKANVAKVQATLVAVNDALKTMMIEERVRNLEDSSVITDSNYFLTTYLKPVKVCENGKETECGFSASYNAIDGTVYTMDKSFSHYDEGDSAIMPSGVSIKVNREMMPDDAMMYGFLIDVNGADKPNVIGRDLFHFTITDDFTVGERTTLQNSNINTICKNGLDFGSSCVDLLMMNDWKMVY